MLWVLVTPASESERHWMSIKELVKELVATHPDEVCAYADDAYGALVVSGSSPAVVLEFVFRLAVGIANRPPFPALGKVYVDAITECVLLRSSGTELLLPSLYLGEWGTEFRR